MASVPPSPMKPFLAGGLTIGVLAAMLVLGSRGPVTTDAPAPRAAEERPATGSTPAQEAVRELFGSGERGDVARYLAMFTGPLRSRIEREVAERGREAFADDLRRASAARKGHALFEAEQAGELAARVAVEVVYADHNERQTYRVERTAEGWRIADVALARSRQPAARFGTPAGVVPSEGGPPQPPQPNVGVTVETGDGPDDPGPGETEP